MRAAPFPAHEQAAEAVVPSVRSFDDPSSSFAPHFANERLLASASDVRSNSAETNGRCYVRIVVVLVETQVLGTSRPTWAED